MIEAHEEAAMDRDIPNEPQPGVLSQLRGEFIVFHNVKFALVLVAALGLLALAVVGLDAAVVLAEAARAHAGWLLVLGGGAVLLLAVLGVRRLRERWVAQTVEAAEPELGTALTNAVELCETPRDTAVGELLRRRAVERGRQRAAGLHAWPIARDGIKAAGFVALGTLGLWLLGAVLLTDVFRAVLPRFLDPHGDHPPYSRLKIDVTPGNTEVLYGGECVITATTSGLEAEKLTLVTRRGEATDHVVMFLGPKGSFFQTLTNLREETEYYVTYGRARTHRYRIAVKTVPQIELVQVESTLPAYTNVPPQREHLTGFTLTQPFERRLPPETRLAFRATSNRPLSHGLLTLRPAEGAPRTVRLERGQETHAVEGSFRLAETVGIELRVVDVEGTPSEQALTGTIELQADQKPTIHVVEPGKDGFATPDAVVPVVVEVEDDYGVATLRMTVSRPDGTETAEGLKLVPGPGARSVTATSKLEMAKLGVEPGDTVEYLFEATDTLPDGPNYGLSRLYKLRVISHEEHREIVRRLLQRDREPLDDYPRLGDHLRRLAERAEALDKETRRLGQLEDPDQADRDALARDAADLARELTDYRQAIDQQISLPPSFDAERRFQEVLQGQRPALDQLQKKLDNAVPDPLAHREEVRQVAEGLAGMCGQCQQQVQIPAEHLRAVARLLSRAQAFAQMSEQQQAVSRAGKEFEDQLGECTRVEEMKLRGLGDGERGISDALDEFEREMPGLIDDLPEDKQYDELRQTARDFLEKLREARVGDDVAEAADEFNKLRGRFAYPPARDAATKMDELVEKMEPMQGQGRAALRFQPGVQLGRSLDQLLAQMLGQGQLGQEGEQGYSMAAQEYGLYGPDFEIPRGGRGRDRARSGRRRDREHVTDAADPRDRGLDLPEDPGHVRLVPNVRYPLRYRRLVGAYFRAIADAQHEKEPRR